MAWVDRLRSLSRHHVAVAVEDVFAAVAFEAAGETSIADGSAFSDFFRSCGVPSVLGRSSCCY